MLFHRTYFLQLLVVMLGLLLLRPLTPTQPVFATDLPPIPHVEYVLHVSVDGLTASLLQDKLAADTAGTYSAFQRLIDEGAYTFNARSDYDTTVTLPNHISMLTARPLWQPFGVSEMHHHGFPHNSLPYERATLHNSGNPSAGYIASVFDVVHDNGMSTALYASKDRFSVFDVSYNATNGRGDSTGPDNGRDKIDFYRNLHDGTSSRPLHDALLADLKQHHINYSFIHYADPDAVGHIHGFGSDEWFAAVADVNSYLLDLMTLIETDATFKNNTILIVTSDHGGTDFKGHGDASMAVNYTVPLFVWGKGVAQNTELYALNPSFRQDPGEGRPRFDTNVVQPIRNGETGTLALALLDLPIIPWSFMTSAINVAPFGAPADDTLLNLFLPLVRGN